MGLRRGGLAAKIHAVVDAKGRPLAARDLAAAVLSRIRAPRPRDQVTPLNSTLLCSSDE